jgi:AcrR family transcriptional regulator
VLTASQLEALRESSRLRPWHEITIDEMAEAVGVSRMTLHRHGVSKEKALMQLRELLIAEHQAAALRALTAEGPARNRMELALGGVCDVDERYLALIDSLAEDLATVFHEEGDGPVLTRPGFTDALRRILIDGTQDGTLRSSDPAEDATLLLNAAGWTYRHLRGGHHWTPEHASRRVVELLMRGVIGDPE